MENMKNQKRNGFLIVRWLVILLLISCVLTACNSKAKDDNNTKPLYGFEVQEATDEFYVNDFANIFTDEQKEVMVSKAEQFDKETGGIQVVITTVESLEDTVVQWSEGFEPENLDIYDISFQMYAQYGIGQDDMGILVLFSKEEIDSYLATGEQMQIYITDADANRILYTYGTEQFYNDQFAEWLIALQDGIIQEIRNIVPSDWKGEVVTEKVANEVTVKSEVKEERNLMQVVGYLIIVFITIVFCLVLKQKTKKEIETLKSAHAKAVDKLTVKYKNEREQYQQEMEAKDSKLKSSQEEKTRIFRELEEKKKELAQKDAFLIRVQALYPNIETRVYQMIEDEFKASAQKVDEVIAQCMNLPANKDNIDAFRKAIDTYNEAEPDVQNYVKADISKLPALYAESCALKKEYERQEKEKRDCEIASRTCEEIRSILLRVQSGNYESYESLKIAYGKYTNLTLAQRNFFPDMQLLHKLEVFWREAEEDYERQERQREMDRRRRKKERRRQEDDRRRREQAYSSSLVSTFSTPSRNSGSNNHKTIGSNRNRSSSGSNNAAKASAPIRQASRPSGMSTSRKVNSGHGGRPSGGGARMSRK